MGNANSVAACPAPPEGGAILGRIAVGSAGVFLCQALTQLAGMAGALVLARYFGPSRYGVLTFAFTYVSFFEAVALLGTNIVTLREMATLAGEAAADFWASMMRVRLVLLSVAAAGVFATAWVCFRASGETYHVVLWCSLGILTIHRSAYICVLRAKMKSVWTGLTALGRALIYLALVAVVAGRGGTLIQVAQASLAASLAGLLVERRLAGPFLAKGGRARAATMRAIFGLAWPVALSSALTIVQVRIDVMMLKGLATDTIVGTYGVALRLGEAAFIIPSAVGVVAFPALAQAYVSGDSARLGALFRGVLFSFVAIALPFCVVLAPLSRDLIVSLFGRSFAASGPVLAVLFWQTPLAYVNILLVNVLFAARQQRLEMWASAATTATNVAANIVLIPMLGATGSALATLASQVVTLAVLGTITYRVTALRFPLRDLAGFMPGAGLALLATLLLHDRVHWIAVAAAGGGVYLAAVALVFRQRIPLIRKALL